MYRAKESFTTKNYDVKRDQILNDNFTTEDEIADFLNIGYIEEYDGILEITENGTYDVTDYEQAEVNVSGGGITTGTVWYTNVYQFNGWQTNLAATSVTDAGDFAYSGSDVKALYQGQTINIVRLVPAQAGIITFRVYNDDENLVGKTNSSTLRDGQTATATITSAMVNQGGYQEIPLSNDLIIGANQFWSVQTAGDTGRFKFKDISSSNWKAPQGYYMYNNLGTNKAVRIFNSGSTIPALCVDVGYKAQ